MKKSIGVALLILALVLSSCGGKIVKIDNEMNGQTVTLQRGETLAVSLEGNPTTGYTWGITQVDASILESQGEAEYDSDSNLIGAGGVFTFKFTAVAAGTTNLELAYFRSFEQGVPPIETFKVTVVVTE